MGQSSIRLYGSTDLALSSDGEAQMAAAGRELGGLRFDRVLTSPMIRARRSTEVVLEHMHHPPIEIEPIEAFREIDFGRWEGWTWSEVAERDPENHARWASEGPEFGFPEGESRRGFVARVQAAVPGVIEQAFASGAERLLVVVHKGVIKAIVARLLGREFFEFDGLELPLGSVHWFEQAPGLRRWRALRGGWAA